MQYTVTAVVVSYNREALLRECLDGLAAQTRPVDNVVVVDNASTDGSRDVIRRHELIAAHMDNGTAHVVELKENTGGAGGFCAGIAIALADFDAAQAAETEAKTTGASQSRHYLWLMDDDTVPTPTALEALLAAVGRCMYENRAMPAALGSKALWIDGREHLMNKPRVRTHIIKGDKYLDMSSFAVDAAPSVAVNSNETRAYQARSLSFVSCLINAGAIVNLGRLPRAAYFLWNDDFEFTTALLRRGIGYYVPASEVVHKTKVFGSSDADPGARFYEEVRNKIWLWRFSRQNFTPVEQFEFLLKTVRRWSLTWHRAQDSKLIADCLKRGWRDGWHTDPQPNVDIFAGIGEVASAIRSYDN